MPRHSNPQITHPALRALLAQLLAEARRTQCYLATHHPITLSPFASYDVGFRRGAYYGRREALRSAVFHLQLRHFTHP